MSQILAALVVFCSWRSADAWLPSLSPWMCHHYVGDQQETDFCATAGIQDGMEFLYTEGGVGSPCFPCWCCKRNAPQVSTTAAISPAITTVKANKVQKDKYVHYPLVVGGMPAVTLVGENGHVNKDALSIEHGAGFTLFSSFQGEWRGDGIAQLKLLGKSISFTVDLSKVGCACNLAFYLIAAPARDWNGQLSAGTNRGGQPPYYCDANMVGGQWCPEMDIMEANTHAFQSTPHKCDAPVSGHYNSCDRGGCGQNTRDSPDAYGPGSGFKINTMLPFVVRTEFVQESGVFTGMKTVLLQGSEHVVLDHPSCSADYLAQLSDIMTSGMSLRITYWGDQASTMSWMDSPPCGPDVCSKANGGVAQVSNITLEDLPATPAAEDQPDAQPTPSAAAESKYSTYDVEVNGLSRAVLAGEGGSVDKDALSIKHGAGFTLFSEFKDTWDPNHIAQLQALGKSISFRVDLSKVGCACNLAFYLISSPARDWNGKPSMGSNRGGQPPFYCDANEVGGQWCPEVDIMEANTNAFQATPHKCDKPNNGHYENCDRGGCDQNTRDQPNAYGPGSDFTIDTRQPFDVRTEFPADGGILIGMWTILSQDGKTVRLDHSSCQADYLAALSDAMKDGMSLRITYWGDRAETMSWMDSPPCGQQACTGSNAGNAVISNITVGGAVVSRPASAASGTTSSGTPGAWMISDPSDKLFGQTVPDWVLDDEQRFVHKGNMGVAQWQHSMHFVKQQGESVEDLVMVRYEETNPISTISMLQSYLLPVAVVVGLAAVTASLSLRRVQQQRRMSAEAPLLVRSDSGLACELAMLESAVEDSESDHVE